MRMLGYENQRKESYSFTKCFTQSIKSSALLLYLSEDFTFSFWNKKVASLHNPYAMDHTLVNILTRAKIWFNYT